ncbi:hypothetical protein KKC63_03175 [Patescibacteria group bacterium]|nr:hypothetical protein [Patescibacteria group bacterium]
MKEKIYSWQKIILWIIGILTFVAVTTNAVGKEFNIGYFLDLIIAIGINTFLLFLVFKFVNWTYFKKSKKEIIKNKTEEK